MPATASRIASLLLCLLFAGSPGWTQQGPPAPAQPPAEARDRASSRSIVFERQYLRVRFEADGSSRREMTMAIRVNDDAGVRQGGQIPLVYAPSSDDLDITRLEVHKADGRTIKVGPEAVQEHAIQPGAAAATFMDLRQKTVTVPALQPGDMIGIVAVWTVARPFAGKHSWFEHSFIKHAVVLDERVELDVPEDMHPVIRTASTAPAESSRGEGIAAGNRRLFTWRTSNLTVPSEPAETPDEAPPADLRVTTFRDWDTFSQWLGPLLRPAADEAVTAKALELTRGLTRPADKVEALYAYVSTQIRYVSLSFGLGRYEPHAPGEVLKNQYGDCKDKHALLAAMLHSIGMTAVPVLLNTNRSISDDFPAPTEFDHVITALPTSEDPSSWTWLDTTTEIAPLGLLTAGTRGRRALALDTRSLAPRLVTTPADGPFPFLDTLTIDGTISALGVLTASVKMQSRGDSELVVRAVIRSLPRESLEEFGKEVAKGLGMDGDISNFSASDPLATRTPVEITFTLRKAGFLDWAAASSVLQTSTGKLDLAALDSERTPVTRDRKLGTPTAFRRRLTLRLPPGYTIAAPPGVTVNKDGFEYSSTYAVDGGTLTVERQLKGQPRILMAAHTADYSRIARSAETDMATTVVVSREGRTMPDIPADMNARELYAAGHSAFEANDFESAVAIFKKSIATDPKYFVALNGLGFAYQRLKRYEESIATLEKQRSLEPANQKLNTDLGFVYREAGRLADAERAYARHIAGNPTDGATQKILAEILADLNRHADAIGWYERALPMIEPDAMLFKQMGDSYLSLNKRDEALKAYDRALLLSPTPGLLTGIAWELADRGVEPDRVMELTARGIAAIAAAMRAVTAEEVKGEHHFLMERLAWAWDARGLVHRDKGETDEAQVHFTSAWKLGARARVMLHLGHVYEKQGKLADAASAYLTARALEPNPDQQLLAKMKEFYPAGDMEAMLAAAAKVAAFERSAPVKGAAGPKGHAEFNAIVNGHGRIVDIAFVEGSPEFKAHEGALRNTVFPLQAPSGDDVRLATQIVVNCSGTECYAQLSPPRNHR